MDLNRIIHKVFNQEKLTGPEMDLLADMIKSKRLKPEFDQTVMDELLELSPVSATGFDREGMRSELHRRISISLARKKKKLRTRYAAAAALLLIAAGGWFLAGRFTQDTEINRIVENAVLTMPDGSEIILDGAAGESRVAQQDNIAVLYREGGLVYERGEEEEEEEAREPEPTLNCVLNIPKGMTFDLVLEDGTHVWLNAASKLNFPAAFGSGERRVSLEGEGYFEVAPDSERPFIVETNAQELTVLGTKFNMYAYADEAKEFTTLTEGSVSLSRPGSDSRTLLRPGQQAALYTGDGDYVVSEVNVDEIMAWHDGIFVFNGKTLDEVFLKLSRWYDFRYELESDVKDRIFRGNLRISEDVSSIFRIIEMSGQMEITRKGKMITVKTKK